MKQWPFNKTLNPKSKDNTKKRHSVCASARNCGGRGGSVAWSGSSAKQLASVKRAGLCLFCEVLVNVGSMLKFSPAMVHIQMHSA